MRRSFEIPSCIDINIGKLKMYIDFGWFRGNGFAMLKLQLFENIGGLLVIFGLQIGYLVFSFGVEV